MCWREATAKDAYLKAALLSSSRMVSDDVDLILMVLVCCSGCIILFCVIVFGMTKTVVFEHICNSPKTFLVPGNSLEGELLHFKN